MKIPIYFLGTGQAIPTAKRNHTSIILEYNEESIMVDCGEGTQRQIRKMRLNPCKITRLLITHWHGDHILGLPGLLQTLALNGYTRTLHIYGPRGTQKFFSEIMNMFVFEGKIKYEIKEIEQGLVFETSDFEVIAAPMNHGIPTLAYSFIEKEKIRIDKKKMKKFKLKEGPIIGELLKKGEVLVNGKKIKLKDISYQDEAKKITFILDTKLNENCYKLAQNSNLLISESTYIKADEEKAKENLHMTAHDAATLAKKSDSERLVLLHISQRYEYKEKIILAEAKKIFKNVIIAEDLTKVEV